MFDLKKLSAIALVAVAASSAQATLTFPSNVTQSENEFETQGRYHFPSESTLPNINEPQDQVSALDDFGEEITYQLLC